MKKQYVIAAIGFAFVLILFYFGKTTTETKPTPPIKPETSKQFDVQQFILQEKQKLSPELSKSITEIENSYAQTEDKSQKITGYNTAANFWKAPLKILNLLFIIVRPQSWIIQKKTSPSLPNNF